jgi:hypothetical protein
MDGGSPRRTRPTGRASAWVSEPSTPSRRHWSRLRGSRTSCWPALQTTDSASNAGPEPATYCVREAKALPRSRSRGPDGHGSAERRPHRVREVPADNRTTITDPASLPRLHLGAEEDAESTGDGEAQTSEVLVVVQLQRFVAGLAGRRDAVLVAAEPGEASAVELDQQPAVVLTQDARGLLRHGQIGRGHRLVWSTRRPSSHGFGSARYGVSPRRSRSSKNDLVPRPRRGAVTRGCG